MYKMNSLKTTIYITSAFSIYINNTCDNVRSKPYGGGGGEEICL